MGSVNYRRVGLKWHIRFRQRGRREAVLTMPGHLPEKRIKALALAKQVAWGEGSFDPWGRVVVDEPGGGYLLAELVEIYCRIRSAEGYWNKKTTATNRGRLTHLLSPLRNVLPHSLMAGDIADRINPEVLAAESVVSYINTANGFLAWAHQGGHLPELIKLKVPRSVRRARQDVQRIRYITWEQLGAVCERHKGWSRERIERDASGVARSQAYKEEIWRFMFLQLLRRAEVLAIKPEHISADGRWLVVYGKGGRVDRIPLLEPARDIIEPWLATCAKGEPIFGISDGKTIWRPFREHVKALFPHSGLNVHSLRHGGIVHYLSQGISLNHVSKLARHANVNITARVYGDVIPISLEQAFAGAKFTKA